MAACGRRRTNWREINHKYQTHHAPAPPVDSIHEGREQRLPLFLLRLLLLHLLLLHLLLLHLLLLHLLLLHLLLLLLLLMLLLLMLSLQLHVLLLLPLRLRHATASRTHHKASPVSCLP
jgi:hypothetical protein